MKSLGGAKRGPSAEGIVRGTNPAGTGSSGDASDFAKEGRDSKWKKTEDEQGKKSSTSVEVVPGRE